MDREKLITEIMKHSIMTNRKPIPAIMTSYHTTDDELFKYHKQYMKLKEI